MSIKDIPKNRKINLYRPEIDGLRAFAVITVIINHINKDFLPQKPLIHLFQVYID